MTKQAPEKTPDEVVFAKAIADETRQKVMALCCCARLTVNEITAQLNVSQPTVSHHLAILRDAGLVTIERDGRETYYSLDQTRVTVCCGQITDTFAPESIPVAPAAQPKRRVLILCTANSARSQMAEAMLRMLADDRYEVHSAGSRATSVNPAAIAVMDEFGVDMSAHFSKTYERYLGQPFDAVITVCDSAADACPFLPGQYNRIHWSFPDPAAVAGEAERLQAFRGVRDGLVRRFRAFIKEGALV